MTHENLTPMLTKIQTIEDVEKFFNELILEENLNFNPDEDFKNYIDTETELPTYTEEEAELRNHLLDQCFEVCEKKNTDIYKIGYEILFNRLGNNS